MYNCCLIEIVQMSPDLDFFLFIDRLVTTHMKGLVGSGCKIPEKWTVQQKSPLGTLEGKDKSRDIHRKYLQVSKRSW